MRRWLQRGGEGSGGEGTSGLKLLRHHTRRDGYQHRRGGSRKGREARGGAFPVPVAVLFILKNCISFTENVVLVLPKGLFYLCMLFFVLFFFFSF